MSGFRFEKVTRAINAVLPKRATIGSAGYDFVPNIHAPVTIAPGQMKVLPTGIKAYMPEGYVLLLFVRSSVGIKRGLVIPNSVGVIDSDYVDNPENEGEIFLALWNIGSEIQTVQPGERIAQGIFVPYHLTDNDNAMSNDRVGGLGSTNN